MDRSDLKAELRRLRVRADAYQIDNGEVSNEAWVLRPAAWEVYYSERGSEVGKKIFASESEACEYLLLRLATDPTTRQS